MKKNLIKISLYVIVNIIVMLGMIILYKQIEGMAILLEDRTLLTTIHNYFFVIAIFIGFVTSFLSSNIISQIKSVKSSNTLREQISKQKNSAAMFNISLNHTLIQGTINSVILILFQ